jgi:iron complex outermembrane receptor protein
MRQFLLPLLCFVSLWSFAQDLTPKATLHVEVRSSADAVSGATISVNGVSATTDERGSATVVVDAGIVRLQVVKEEFLPATESLTLVPNQEQEIIVELQPQPEAKEEITVSATRTDKRLQDEPTRVEILGREEIEEKMLMTPGDIVMMMNEMGGMRVQATSPSLGAASIRIQGMKGRYTRFFQDGLPLFGQQVGGLGLLQIPPMDLRQVEVIKGGASALYGAGAMGGIVNLVSRRPGTEPNVEMLVNRSSLGASDAVVFATSALSSHWSASLLGSGNLQERNDIDGDGWADLSGYGRGVIRPRLFWDGGNGRTAFITTGVTYENREGGTMFGSVLPATGLPYTEALDTRRYDIGATSQFLIDNKYLLTFRGAGSTQGHRHGFGDVLERDRHNTLFGEGSIRGAAGRHTWVAGMAFERSTYDAQDVPQVSYAFNTPGLFVQDDITVTQWFSLSASGRVDFHNQYGTFFSPRISALLKSGDWSSRLSLGHGFFASTPLTEETEAAGLSRLVIPQTLKAEHGSTVSFDLTRTIGPSSYTVTLFGSRIQNPLKVERGTLYTLTNFQEATTNAGIEALATLRYSPFSITGTYTYVRSKEGEQGQRLDIPLTPRHSAGLVGMWEWEGVARIGVEGYYTGEQRLEVNPYRNRSKPYFIFGALAERRFGPVRLFINAENITNVRQTKSDSLLRSTQAVDGRWTVDAWAPLDGRVLNGGLRFNF